MKKILTISLIVAFIFLTGCGLIGGGQTHPTQPVSAPTVEVPIDQPPLTLDDIKNSEIFAPQLQKKVQLLNGKFESGSGADYALIQILPQSLMADLNGDGDPDGIVLLAENSGGSGVFVSLIPFLSSGNSFTQGKAEFIDDRPQINGLSVTDGRINLNALVHTDTDPMVSPSWHVVETFRLYTDNLVIVDLVSTINGYEHNIIIETPTESQTVSGSVQVKGSMPITPFENNLRLRFYDDKNQVISEGPFVVQADDMGKPATFDQSLILPNLPSGSKIRLELADLSEKDGSPISIASIDLIAK